MVLEERRLKGEDADEEGTQATAAGEGGAVTGMKGSIRLQDREVVPPRLS